MSGDSVDFELDLNGNTAQVAKKMAAELKVLEAQLLKVNNATRKTERGFAQSRWFNAGDMARHASAVTRLRKGYLAMAPASSRAASAMRMFGVHGSSLRKFSVDAAKAEIALRRLHRIKGGGVRGGLAVAGAMVRRGGLASKAGNVASRGLGAAGAAAGSVGSAALVAGGATAAGAGLLGYSLASTAIEAERVRFALDRVTNGDGAKWWAKSSEYASKFGMNVNMVAQNLMDMKASGFDDGTVDTLFLRMGDLRALGANEETLGRAMLAIRQVASAGRLQGDELNQLSEAGINANIIFEVLAKKLGKSRAEIMKMKEAGKLTSDIVIPAIGEAIGVKTGGGAAGEAGAAAANSTVSGLWGKMTGSWSVAAANSMQGGQLDPLKTAISSFTSWMTGAGGQQAIGAFSGVIARMFEAAPVIIEKVIWFLDEGLPQAWASFSAAFASSGGSAALDSLLSNATSLGGESGGGFINFLLETANAAGNLAGAITTVVNAMVALGNTPLAQAGMFAATAPFKAVGWVSGLLSGGESGEGNPTAEQAGAAGMTIGQSMAAGMSQGLYAGGSSVSAAAAFLASSAEQAARSESETHSPSKVFERYASDNVDGAVMGYQKGIPRIQSAASDIGKTPSRGDSSGESSGGMGPVTVHIAIDRGQGEGKSDRDLMELAAEIFERRMTRVFGQLAYSGVG